MTAPVPCPECERNRELIHVLWAGCKCDPPGSGEEFCSGACYAREDAFKEAIRIVEGFTGDPNWSHRTASAIVRKLRQGAARPPRQEGESHR